MGSSGVELNDLLDLNGTMVMVTLSHPRGLLHWSGAKNGSLSVPHDLLGYTQGHTTITLHAFKMPSVGCCIGGTLKRVREDIVLKITDAQACQLWCEALQRCLDSQNRPKRLLFVINPYGGKGRAKKIFVEEVQPLLGLAGLTYTVKETQFQRHAKDLAKTMNLSDFDAVVCVSGDGVLVEVLNGLLERSDWTKAVGIPIGVIPSGTGNGVAKSLLSSSNEPCDAAHATFAIIRGCKRSVDVVTVTQGQTRFHSILSLSWGLPADVDIESERLRCLGMLRVDIYSIIRILSLRRYIGSLVYVPAPGYEELGEPLSGDLYTRLFSECPATEMDSERSWRKVGYMGPDLTGNNSEWRTIKGPFVLVWLQNVPYAAIDLMPTPLAKFADGFVDMMIIRDCPRWELLLLMLKIADGSHIKSKYVEYLKVKAMCLAPNGRVGSDGEGGIVTIDGEALARGKGSYGDATTDMMSYGPLIQLTVEKGLATLLCPPSIDDNYSTSLQP